MFPCLHTIRKGSDDRVPLLVTHGLQCDITFAALLSRELPPEQPVYAFSAPGLDGRETPLTRIDALAQRFVEEARAIPAPQGVVLVGFCSGAHVALPMVPLLEAAGIAVRHVYLVDAPRKMRPGEFDRLAEEQIQIATDRLVSRPELKRHFGGGPATVRAYTDALKQVEPRRHVGPATIVSTAEMHDLIMDKTLGWPNWLADGTRVMRIAETREELLSQGIAKIAAIVRQPAQTPAADDLRQGS